MFFKKDDRDVPAVLNQPGPENSALMLGAEEFRLEFSICQAIEPSLKQCRQTAYRWRQEDHEFASLCDEAHENAVDQVESTISGIYSELRMSAVTLIIRL